MFKNTMRPDKWITDKLNLHLKLKNKIVDHFRVLPNDFAVASLLIYTHLFKNENLCEDCSILILKNADKLHRWNSGMQSEDAKAKQVPMT